MKESRIVHEVNGRDVYYVSKIKKDGSFRHVPAYKKGYLTYKSFDTAMTRLDAMYDGPNGNLAKEFTVKEYVNEY